MNEKKNTLAAVLATVCIMSALFAWKAYGSWPYNPWWDVNDDGRIDIQDLARVSGAFGTAGTPLTKTSLEFDSGWINLTGQTGENYTLTHNLNRTVIDMIVDARQRRVENVTYGGKGHDMACAVVKTNEGGYAIAGFSSLDFWLVKTDVNGYMQWNKTYGGVYRDEAYSLVQTGDGGYALAGVIYGMISDHNDAWLMKTDASGSMQWNRTFGKEGAYDDRAYSVVQTGDGGYAVAGYTNSFGAGDYDCWLIKTDADGNEQWNKTYGGIYRDEAYSLVQTSDGGYALAGLTTSFSVGGRDAYVVKTDVNGILVWHQRYGGVRDDLAYDLVQTGDGGFAVGGSSDSFDVSKEFYLFRTGSDGNIWWNKTYGVLEARTLVQTSDGGYALMGWAYYSYYADYKLVKTDAEGSEQWNRTYVGAANINYPCGMVQASDGGYALVGNIYSEATLTDGWLIRTDAFGQRLPTESGLTWTSTSFNTIILHKKATDQYWGYIRVQISRVHNP